MKKTLFLGLVVLLGLVSSCATMKSKMLQKGLYEVEFDNSDYAYAMSILRDVRGKERDDIDKSSIRFDLGFTSTVEQNGILARNYNDYIRDAATFVVRTKKGDGRFSSVGVAPGFDSMNDEFVSKALKFDSYYKVLPFLLVDGINENGVVVTLSSYPVSDFSPETVLDLYKHGNFSPKRREEMIKNMVKIKEKRSFEDRMRDCSVLNSKELKDGGTEDDEGIFIIMSVRYLLDKASSAENAVDILRKKKLLDYPTTDDKDRGYHFMIADNDNCVCVEFIDGEMFVDADATVMTDYSFNNLSSYSMMGQERYDILRDRQRGMTSRRAIINVMKDMYYSKAYDASDPNSFWYSECYTDKGMFMFNPPSLDEIDENFDGNRFFLDYFDSVFSNQSEIRKMLSLKSNRPKDRNVLYTAHTSVYDIKERNLTLIARENNIEFDFRI
ncbi:MAG TPA: hypothetical protein DCO86_05440 [Spirochaetaceae bacterium]|nr:hypothetical protein [Spirochaetaceae bacterium]